MRPTGRYVVRTTGCGWFLGVALILIGLIVLLDNVGPHWSFHTYWPVILIGLGLYLLFRHYWRRYRNRNPVSDILDVGIIPRLQGRNRSWRPPDLPIILIAIGVCWLLYNLVPGSQRWVIWVVVLIAVGLLMLGGTIRASASRS